MSGVPSWARVGVKVVCIHGAWVKAPRMTWLKWLAIKALGLPIVGGTYTITSVVTHPYAGGAALHLKGWGDLAFHADFFRPLITLEDDLKAHFTALLDVPAPHGVDA